VYHAIYESKLSKLIIIIIIIYFTLFNFVIYSWTDNIPQEDLAIFGYRPGISNFGYMLEPNREFWQSKSDNTQTKKHINVYTHTHTHTHTYF